MIQPSCSIGKPIGSVPLFLIRFAVHCFKLCFVGQGHVAFHLSVVQRIGDPGVQVAEHGAEVNGAADRDPDRGDGGQDPRDDQERDQEIDSPPGLRPRIEQVPDDDHDEGPEEPVNDTVTEITPSDDLVPESVFGSDADKLVEQVFSGPDAGDHGLLSVQRIFAAVEHAFQIERLFRPGDRGKQEIQPERHHHGNEIPFVTVDRTLDLVHLPDYDRVEGARNGFQRFAHRTD